MGKGLVLVVDGGTTNVKAALVSSDLRIVAKLSQPIPKAFPKPGWVEQDPDLIFQTVQSQMAQLLSASSEPIVALGITNQRETTVLWDKTSSTPLYPAIVWEDNRNQELLESIQANPSLTRHIRQTTGLTPSPYFSAFKLNWLLKNLSVNISSVQAGTIDSWLIYKLTGGHLTDYTNASRTLLFDIHKLAWDRALLDDFAIPEAILPQVLPSNGQFGEATINGQTLPIRAVMGDQQASLYAAGNTAGTIKATYGTGIFPMKIIDNFSLVDGLSTTLGVGIGGQPLFALEGKIGNGSARTTPALHDPAKLDEIVKQIAAETAPVLAKLLEPSTKSIVVDGGISQNNTLVVEQERLSHVKLVRQTDYDATLVGTAKLLFDTLGAE